MTSKGRPTPWHRLRHWPALFLALLAAQTAAAQTPAALRQAIAQLKQEAVEARQNQSLPEQPDFASRYDGELTDAQLQAALLQPVDRDAFVDAYVRWQLTSFQPQLQLDQRQFMQLLRELPPLLENPRGELRTLWLIEKTINDEPLAPATVAQLQEYSRTLDERTAATEELNRPAMELRAWLRESAVQSEASQIFMLIEECAATIEGVWSTRSVKMRLSMALSQSAESDSLSHAEQRQIAESLEQLAGRSRMFINQFTFMADGSVNVSYSHARVTRRDVDRWLERLAGTP